MARIALRAYNREIEHLIEGGQIEEAIAHCRHIFKYFPKHINTYRLLGKAYLETQRYGDAADILQRVLSSIPDDFISHLGMSIIREDEGNLDEAIWHMERAFEVQPANRAIQDELRRLYGRRDGLEPPKIRLTRGALARMYAKGDLYPQAIAELRAALAEDPQRMDLQVVLADVYGKAGQRVEAASICNGLLRKLPYCLVANQVMAEILADSERSEDARVYRQRAQALDAYLAHTSPGAPTPDKVPDIAVSLERLDWQPGKALEGPSQPDWAASLGVELEAGAAAKEEIPDWLSAVQSDSDLDALPAAGEASAPFTDLSDTGTAWEEEFSATELDAQDTAQPSTEAEIPDWMKAAGWSPSTGSAEEEAAGFDFDEEDFSASEPEGELEEANLPDWLKEIAPENLDQAPEAFDEALDEDATILQDTPDWFKETEDGETEQEESSDWLAGLAGAAAAGMVAGAVAGADEEAPAEAAEDLPDWLKEMEAEEATDQADQVPEWLEEGAAEEELLTPSLEDAEETAAAEEVPDWLQEMEIQEETATVAETESEAEAELAEEIPDWLKEMGPDAGETVVSEAEMETEPESAEELPDWLQETPVEEVEPEAETTQIEIEAEAAPGEELQPWMIAEEEELAGEKMAEHPAEPAEEMPDWLIEMGDEEAAGALQDQLPDAVTAEEAEIEPASRVAAEALSDEGMTVITMPDEIEQEPAEEIPEMLGLEEEIEPEQPVETPAPGLEESAAVEAMDADAAFAWLESLAAKQGAEEEDLLLKPEERTETPPGWVQAAIESEAEAVEQAAAQAETEIEAISEIEEAPIEQELEDEVETPETIEIVSETTIIGEPIVEAEIGEIPEIEFQEDEEQILAELEEAEQPETLPDWLKEAGDVFETEAEGEEPIPDWLEETGETGKLELEEPAQPAEELPDWLKSMQLEQEEAEAPELEPAEELPDWLQELPEEEQEQEQAAEIQEDWLAELEEPLIEGDTKPTRLMGIEEAEQAALAEDEGEPAPTFEAEAETLEPGDAQEEAPAYEAPSDADADFAWLESLAAKQGAEEGMLLEPEDRLEGPPEWIQTALDKQFGDIQTQEAFEELVEPLEELPAESQPTILEEVVEAPESVEETPDLPDWLSEMEAEAEQDEAAEAIEALTETAATIEQEQVPELPSWLADTEEKEEPAWTPVEPAITKLDLNEASLAELERLPGIGFIMAQKIITYREQHGPFKNALDLQQIPGFSPAMLQEIDDFILVETAEEEPLHLPVETGTPPELVEARREMLAGELEDALDKYSELILKKMSLDEVIYDLNQILARHGDNAAVWQTLGDAQMRANQVHEALEAYTRAEQLFR